MRAAIKTFSKLGHSSFTRNGDHLGQLITTGSTQKEIMMSPTVTRTLKNCKREGVGEKHSQT